MADGIHVQLEASGIAGCPVTSVSERAEVESVTTGRQVTDEGTQVVGEFTAATDAEVTDAEVTDSVETVFSDADASVYRFSTEGADCPCGRLPDHGCPVRDVRAESGSVVVAFIVPDVETLQTVVTDLRDMCDTVRVRRLTRSTADDRATLLVVDRSAFTDRQYEVLETAHELGYFDRPREATATDVAAQLDISVATFSEHLAASQRKLLDQILNVQT